MTKRQAPPLLSLRFEGPATKDGTILWDDLSQFITNLDSAIQRIINVMERGSSTHVGRPTKVFQALTALEVTGVANGSFRVGLNLRRTQDMLPGFDLGVKAVLDLASGVRALNQGRPLPQGFDRGVLIPLREASRILDRGVDTVHIRPRSDLGYRRLAFQRKTQERISTWIRDFEQAWAEAEGRLLMADLKEDALKCRLHPSSGEPILCSFSDDITPVVVQHLRQFVRVKGDATFDPSNNRIKSFVIRDIEPVTQSSAEAITFGPLSKFWEAHSFEDLASEQGVYPVGEWQALTGGWPEGADFDSFLDAIKSARRDASAV